MQLPPPPLAPRRPEVLEQFGDERVDPYRWLRDRDDPAVRAYLVAENEYAEAALAATKPLEDLVYDEIRSRIVETDVSAAVRFGGWWYYQRTFEGRSYPVHCRRAAGGEPYPTDLDAPGEQVVLDENELAEGHSFCSVGVLSVAPDHRRCAVGVDFEGDERHELRFTSLGDSEAPSERLTDVGYAVAWTSDSSSLFYVRTDDAWRPHQLWRHVLGEDPASDVLVFEEPDERFRVDVAKSRDGGVLVIHVSSATTSEVLALDAGSPGALEVVWPRRAGVECAVEHLVAPDGARWWVAVTNDGAEDFRLLASPRDAAGGFEEILEERPGTRLDGADAFAGHLVVTERLMGEATVRLVPLRSGADPFGADLLSRSTVVSADQRPATTELGANLDYGASSVRVVQSTLVAPTSWYDVDLASGRRVLRKRTEVVGGYDPGRFTTARLWVTARDGTEIPVSIVHRSDLLGPAAASDAAPVEPAPLLLYGYGAYETCIEPRFSSLRLSLVERGVIYAIAHVRGGGEMGRRWYESGRLEHKATTFTDFVDVARGLVALGFTEPRRLGAMGGSAGGLLMGAAVNLAPELFRAVVAEVPFVDVLSTMLDPTLPLTVGEWEEWGDPLHDEEAYRRMKSWSPVDNVAALHDDGSARAHPELFVLGSLNDTRVSYWEPAKWVATLRAVDPAARIILRTDLGAGHAGPSGRYDAWREYAMIYAYLLDRLGAVGPGHDDD